jgi:hypothetical protein
MHLVFDRYADAVIVQADAALPFADRRFQGDQAIFARVFYGIGKQVDQAMPEQLSIQQDRRWPAGMGIRNDLPRLGLSLHFCGDLSAKQTQVECFPDRFNLTGFNSFYR